MSQLRQEFRFVLRSLARAQGYTALAVGTLALALALMGSVFALLNAYLVRDLPYPAADRLYSVRYAVPPENPPPGLDRLDWTAISDLAEHLIAWDLDMFYLMGGDHPVAAPGAWVTPGFMQGLGLRPGLGRSFATEEFLPGAPQVALISHGLWQTRFGGDSAVIGRRFEAYASDRPDDPEIFTVVGVLPAGFWHVNPYVEVLTPLRAPSYPYQVSLRAGVPPELAASRITALVQRGVSQLPAGWAVRLTSVHQDYAARIRPTLLAIAASVALVLLIAAGNVAMLALLRAMRRQRETTIRLALGAPPGAVLRPFLIEAVLVAGAGLALGALLARLTVRGLAPMVERQLGRSVPGGAAAVVLDLPVLAALAGLTALVALLVAIVPAAVTARRTPVATLRRDRRTGADGTGGRRVRFGLVTLELAGSVALIVGSGLMVRTVVAMTSTEPRLDAAGVVSANLGLRERNYPDAERQAAFHARFLDEVARLPGVERAAMSNPAPLSELGPRPVAADRPGASRQQAGVVAISPEFLDLLRIPLRGGRAFSAADRGPGAPVALVSETLARRLWPEGSAIGQTIRVMHRRLDTGDTVEVRRTVVGVVGDVRHTPTDQETADVYVPLLQEPGRHARVLVRASGTTERWGRELRRVAAGIDPEATLSGVRPLADYAADQLARPRFLAALFSGFGLFATALALLGVYGVVAFVVEQREREVAVRIAVGASGGAVLRLFAREAAGMLAVGLGAGFLGAVLLGRILRTQLYGVPSVEPFTLAAAALLVTAGMALATWWPARRATRIDPALALRED